MSEISYSDYLDFRIEDSQFSELENHERDLLFEDHLVSVISRLTSVSGLPFMLPGDDLVELLKRDFQIRKEKPSVVRLYAHFLILFRDFHRNLKTSPIPPDYQIEYKGDSFRIHPVNEKFTCGEVIEAREHLRELSQILNAGKDPDGSHEFTFSLKAVAVLLRKPGELLPFNYEDRKKFVNERATHFQDLPADVVFSVLQYFHLYFNRLSKDPSLMVFFKGKPRQVPTEAKAREAYFRHKEEQRVINELVGMKQLYYMAFRQGWYKSLDQLFQSDFVQLAYNLNVHSAMN